MKKPHTTSQNKSTQQTGSQCSPVHYKSLFMSAASAIVVLDDNAKVEEVNDAFTHITGYGIKDICCENFSSILASDDADSTKAIEDLFNNPGICSRFKSPLKCHSGNIKWVEITVSSFIESEDCRHIICIFNDITYDHEQNFIKDKMISELQEVKELQEENSAQLTVILHELDEKNAELEKEINERKKAERLLRESEERFKSLSITDQLTGLYNRRQLHIVFENEIRRSKRYDRPLSILLMDVDDFKNYNDTYGHLAGDSVLAALGDIIRKSIRETDKAFRYGGEEFLVVLPETNGDEALTTARRILQAMRDKKFYPDVETEVVKTLSIGIAEYCTGELSNDLLKRADDNMYKAKIGGKNRIFYLHEICN